MTMKKLLIIICFIVMIVHLSAGEIDKIAVAGKTTTLPCIFEGSPSHVIWLKEDSSSWNVIFIYGDNTNSGTINNGKYSVHKDFSNGESSYLLTIADVELADAGLYRCSVTDGKGVLDSELDNKTYNIKVLDALYTSDTRNFGSATALPTTLASTPTGNNTRIDDTGSANSRLEAWKIAVGVIAVIVAVDSTM